MPILRLTQIAEGPGAYRVELTFEGGGLVHQATTAHFRFALSEQDEADLRWYLEDYLQWPQEPAPTVAARVEKRMAELGSELFHCIFQSNKATRELWSEVSRQLAATRVEIVSGARRTPAIPWELLCDPRTGMRLALGAHSFVRAQLDAKHSRLPAEEPGPVRILLVICRPGGRGDVPFRSVAIRILKGLSETARPAFDLDVLRPATFEALRRTLREAKAAGRPYHVVHFDGHGLYLEIEKLFSGSQADRRAVYPNRVRSGAQGYLLFENPGAEGNQRLVDGLELGVLLYETQVAVLVLNASRSAHSESPGEKDASEPYKHVRAWGSLAQEVMDAGLAGVVAMRYNIYVVTAAQFVAELYAALSRGPTLGEAVTLGRKNLADQPLREVVGDPLPLQDWMVPIVYEAAPISLFASREGRGLVAQVGPAEITVGGGLDPAMPSTPHGGFWGRDETLLALDRAFDQHPMVLLHGDAGSGKTTTAAEFARWYALTGGIEGPVLFTTFEQHQPLARVLDRVGEVFGPTLERQGVHWLALDDAQRRQSALQVLRQVPVLWIWDNVEPVSGFGGVEPAWSPEEQRELADFLRAARETRARFLLTSRREEKAWLGDLLRRIVMPPMPMTERLQLARALAAGRGRRVEIRAWRPLLKFSGGNPLTLTVLVGQALRDRLEGRAAVEAFTKRLRAGEATFDDEAGEARSRSLGASLDYGFEHAFDEKERRQLALLHLFQGFVDVDALCTMGNPDVPWCLPEVRGLDLEKATALLDRAVEVGLLRPHGAGTYGIHPALPWFFRGLFEEHYSASREVASRAFVEAMGELGDYCHYQYGAGNREVIGTLRAQEENLLQARRLARIHGWWGGVISAMQGLRQLYGHTGRRAEWKRLVDEIVPDYVDPATEGPRAGREEHWGLVTEYRAGLAQEDRSWTEAERLQQALVEWARQQAAPFLARSRESLDGEERNTLHNLTASLHELGQIRLEMGSPDCVASYAESLEILESIGEQAGASVCAFNLGRAHQEIAPLRDLAQADHWYRRSLELQDDRDRLGQGRCLGQLGHVAFERFEEVRIRENGEDELLRHLSEAVSFYTQALALLPPDAVDELAVTHNQLGAIYGDAGDIDRALQHFRDAIRHEEHQGNVYGASQTRFNVSLALAQSARPQDALEYARAALRGFESYGKSASEEVQRTLQLVGRIEGQPSSFLRQARPAILLPTISSARSTGT